MNSDFRAAEVAGAAGASGAAEATGAVAAAEAVGAAEAARAVGAAEAAGAVAFGAMTRSGSVVLLALRATDGGPAFAGRWEAPLMPADLPVQPYHAAADLSAAAAESLIGRCERAAEDAAVAALRLAAEDLAWPGPAHGVAVVVKPVSMPASVAVVLRSHAWMHAAEGVLYREAMLAGARRCGWQAVAVDGSSLPSAEPVLAGIGVMAGRPWRRIEKDAARAALTLLQSA